MPPFEIEADPDRRILRTQFSGVVTSQALQAAAARSASLIAQMRPGFIVVADLTGLQRMDLDCVPHITRLMDLFRRAGVGRVMRVIPDAAKDIGFTLLSHTHYRGKVPFQTLASLAEAESALGRTFASLECGDLAPVSTASGGVQNAGPKPPRAKDAKVATVSDHM